MKRSQSALLGTLSFLITLQCQAADTDVYFNRTGSVRPNVLFMLDNSGSMENGTMETNEVYDPNKVYAGDFARDRAFIVNNGSVPQTPPNKGMIPLDDINGCEVARLGVAVDGFATVKAAAAFTDQYTGLWYATGAWFPADKVKIRTPIQGDIQLECKEDRGVHGSEANPTGPSYTAETGNALYASNDSDELHWGDYPYVTIYGGNYLNYRQGPANVGTETVTKAEVQERVLRDVIKRNPNINAGLLTFSQSGSRSDAIGMLTRRISSSNWPPNRARLIQDIEGLDYNHNTPLAATLLEGLHYYNGMAPYLAQESTDHTIDSNALDGSGNYISPIEYECQRNFVVMTTDGKPYSDDAANTDFVAGSAYANYNSHVGRNNCDGNCLDEIAAYLAGDDASPLDNLYDLDGDGTPDPQNVKVYPVGMKTQQDLLDTVAQLSGTRSYYTRDAGEFEDAFTDIMADIWADEGLSMTTASTSLNMFNRISAGQYAYYGLFVPDSRYQWAGNLKKFRIAYDANDVAYLTDQQTSNPTITNDDGSLKTTAHSYWSDSADGSRPLAGGVVERLAKRSGARLIRGLTTDDATGVQLMSNTHKLDMNNQFLLDSLKARGRSLEEQENAIKYALGEDRKDKDNDGDLSEQRGHIGSIMRSSPVSVQYGGTEAEPISVVFAVTGDGALHAFDDKTGDELWAIYVKESFQHFLAQYDNRPTRDPWWGTDGHIRVIYNDTDRDGVIEESEGDSVYLYISGGLSNRRFYIFDVTRARHSSQQVKLIARSRNRTVSGWEEFGMSLSDLVPVRYRLRGDTGAARIGFVYAQGLDPDAEFTYGPNTMGRGLSLHEADPDDPGDFGDIVWSSTRTGGNSDMDYSFAASPTPVDVDGDGLFDLLYAIDVNAQLWRFTVNHNATSGSELLDGGILARLGKDQDSDRRRAYKRVDAALVSDGRDTFVVLAVGTGDRMNPYGAPKKQVDRLYVIKDKTALSGQVPQTVLTDADFYNATKNHAGADGNSSQRETALNRLASKSGWYVRLNAGRKALSEPLISDGIVNFPVYDSNFRHANTVDCSPPPLGRGVLFRMNLLDATPVADYSGDGTIEKTDREFVLDAPGIPGDVGTITSPSGTTTVIINLQTMPSVPDPLNPEVPGEEPPEVFDGGNAGYWFQE